MTSKRQLRIQLRILNGQVDRQRGLISELQAKVRLAQSVLASVNGVTGYSGGGGGGGASTVTSGTTGAGP